MLKVLRTMSDVRRPTSLSTRLRRRRFRVFEELVATAPRPLRILDVGGTAGFWVAMGKADDDDVEITVLNLHPDDTSHPRIQVVVGDATVMTQYADDSFDAVFSNSVIEHVGTLGDQARMAGEVRRLAPRYCLQTPCRTFLLEPHFLFPFFGIFPLWLKTVLIQHLSLAHMPRLPDRHDARRAALDVRLLRRRELLDLFPDARLVRERLLGVTKSFTVVRSAGDGPNA